MLVVVSLKVTVPIPETLTLLVNEPGVAIIAAAVPVEPNTDHAVVPLLALPANVKDVGPEGAV